MKLVAKHIIFIGRVQGVGFRFTSLKMANRHQLTGWVRNLPDGTVEMVAQGHPDDVDSCIQDILESFMGPIETEIEEVSLNPQLSDFKITF